MTRANSKSVVRCDCALCTERRANTEFEQPTLIRTWSVVRDGVVLGSVPNRLKGVEINEDGDAV
jgi:hypothetical protein